jgi:hypothetical protein
MRVSILVAGILLVAQYGCKTASGFGDDAKSPLVTVTVEDPSITTGQNLHFVVRGSDNISLRTIGWSMSGAGTRDTSIEFTVTTHSFYQPFTVTDDLTPGLLLIVATATDGSGNEAVPDSAMVTVVAQ